MTTETVTLPAIPSSEDESVRLLAEGYSESRVGAVLVYTPARTLAEVAGADVPSADDTLPAEQISGSDVGAVLSLPAIVALARAGHTTAAAVLALTNADLLGIEGIGEATVAKLRALAGVPDPDAAG